jgi:thioredoxin-like negative regulator of GroEL
MEILARLGVAAAIILAGVVIYLASTKLRLFLLRRRAKSRNNSIGLELREGVPAILYFTTPDCAPCRTVQGPAIEELSEQLGDRLQIVKVDASARTDLADYWGVLSVPTTFIIDAQGRPRHVNNGVTPAARLRQQLREFAGLIDTVDEKRRAAVPKKHEAFRAQRG